MRIKFARLKDRLSAFWRSGLIGAAGSIFLGLLFLMSRSDPGHPQKFALGDGFSKLSYDLPLKHRPPVKINEAVIVFMDDDSRKRLGQEIGKPWDRRLHARLLEKLKADGAAVVVMDVLFDEPSEESANRELAAAIKAHGKVLLASHVHSVETAGKPPMDELLRPVAVLDSNALSGVIDFYQESDGKVRRHFYHPDYISMAWGLAEMLGKAPAQRAKWRWINYYGPAGSIDHVPYAAALATNELPPLTFSSKFVFVGKDQTITPEGTSDVLPTPVGRLTGVEIQATACLNFLRGDWLRELTPVTEFFLFLFLGTIFGYGLAIVRPWTAAALGLAGSLTVAAVGFLLVWKFHFWFPWLIICAVQIPCALGWSFLANTKRVYDEKDVLEEKLSKVTAGAPTPAPASSPDAATTVEPVPQSAQIGPSGLAPGAAPQAGKPAIPDHDLVRCIGRGAYGEVWLARDIIGSFHAVKVVYRRTFSSDGPFDREFRGIQKFTPISRSHPGFVNILHVGRNNAAGYFYYIMELGDDETTGQQIDPGAYRPKNLAREIERRGRLPAAECLQLSLALTAALDCLHRQQLIHRDIKPSNIIFVNGASKIADIGLVTQAAENGDDATYIGTEGYIPPEGPGTRAADVYSLGKVLYEASMGRRLAHFPELPTTLVERHDCQELLELNEIILKACENSISARYRSAGDMHADLAQLQTKLETRQQR